MKVTVRMVTPRRNWPLPETLSERELRLLLNAKPNPRDRLLVALLAGCGLRVSFRQDDPALPGMPSAQGGQPG